jgi:cyclase
MAHTRVPGHLDALAPGVHAYVQPDGGWCLNNAGIIAGDGATLLIDTAATQSRTEALRSAVASLTPEPVSYVVNTHHHGDHTHGNYVFADTAQIIGHDLCPGEVAKQGDLLQHLWPEVEWGDVTPVGPTRTFAEAVTVDVGGITVELQHLETAHTTNDVVAFIPEHGVLFAGDLVFSGGTPFILMGSLAGSLAALERLNGFGAEHVVSGHGRVGDSTMFDVAQRYLHWLRETAEAGLRRGESPLELAKSVELGEFATLLNPERLPANLHRAYAELAAEADAGFGASADADADADEKVVAAGIADLIAFGDGARPECLA